MSLKYPHPKISNTADGQELWNCAVRWTEDVPDTVPLESLPDSHFQNILKRTRSHGPTKVPATRGKYLEMCVYDLVARIAVEEGVPLDTVELHVDMKPPHHAEADILVNNRLALLVKVSYRERWKQVDRDAMVMTAFDGKRSHHNVFRAWSVFNSEHDGDGLRQVQKKSASVEAQCFAPVRIVSVKDHAKMSELIADIRWAVKDLST